MFVFGIVSIEVWNTGLPVWGFVLAIVICKIEHRCVPRPKLTRS